MKQRPGAVKAEPQKNEITPQSVQPQIIEIDGAGMVHMDHDAGQQAQAPGRMNQQITISRGHGRLGATGPDEENGKYGQHFPEYKKSEEIAGKYGPQSASAIKKTRHLLKVVLDMEGIQDGDKTDKMKNISEQQTQFVHPFPETKW